MEKKNVQPPQVSLLLRVLGGGYLVYLAYELLFKSSSKPGTLILVSAILFALVGNVLLVVSLYQLVTHEYFYQKDTPSEEETEPGESDDHTPG